MRRLAVLFILMLAVVPLPSFGQPENETPATPTPGKPAPDPNIQAMLAGETYPLTLKLKDLNGAWRRFTVGGTSDAMGGYMQALTAMMGGGAADVYYSLGNSVAAGHEVFLVAYRPRRKAPDFSALMRSGPNAPPPAQEKLTPETALNLTFLNLRTIGSLGDIRPFDLQQEIAETEKPSGGLFSVFGEARQKAQDASSSSNMKQVGLALLMYVQDYDERFPPMKSPAAVKKLLMPYVKNEAVFSDPATKQPYLPNPVLSGKLISHIPAPAQMVAFYEPRPARDGTRGVCFADGHVKRVQEAEWPKIRRASKIP